MKQCWPGDIAEGIKMDNVLYRLNDVCYSYLGKFPALNNMSLEIKTGQRVAILGANGSGKSTLLRILAGLAFAQKGSVKVFEKDLGVNSFNDESFRKDFRSRIAVLFQNPDAQLFSPTVEEELYFGPLQLDIPKAEAKSIVDALCENLGLKGLLKRTPYQLSIGEKKKVAIAAILAVNPQVLLLDEPTAGLDPATSSHLIDIIADSNEAGKTIITATHDLHLVSEIANKVYVLSQEKSIVASGTPQEILGNQDLLIKHNLVHIHKHKHDGTWHKHLHDHGHIHEH